MQKSFFSIGIVTTLLFISCSKKVQLFKTEPISQMKVENQAYTFENDTIKIVYSFWGNHGALSYTVFNKLDVPLYIDWKKSSFVSNSNKLDYWIDQSTTNSLGAYRSSLITGSYLGRSYNKSTTIKQEQIIFIAPKSRINKAQFLLYPFSKKDLTGNAMVDVEKRTDKPNKTIKIKYVEFTQSNSPLFFRNFLTISTSDKFNKETYIDNGFYVSKISEMDNKNFWGKWIKNKLQYSVPFENPQSFYIDKK